MRTKSQPIRQNRLANLLVEASPIAMLLTDGHGRISLINPIAESWFGYQEKELLGKPVGTLLPLDLKRAPLSQPARMLSHPFAPLMAEEDQIFGQTKDGSRFPVIVKLQSFHVDADKMIFVYVTKLNGQQSVEKQIRVEKLAAILEMTSGLAHETNNALQRARSCLDLLEMDLSENPTLMHLTDRIRDALNGLHKNYQDVRNYAAPITLKLGHQINIAQLCQTVFDELTELSKTKHLLTIRCENIRHQVSFDVSRMQQVLQGIMDNAIAASPEGAVIEFDCRTAENVDALEIEIRDHGPGFSDIAKDRAFEPFFTTKQHGTGLGLAVFQRIVEAHGGSIVAENHPDGGAVVRILIPFEQK